MVIRRFNKIKLAAGGLGVALLLSAGAVAQNANSSTFSCASDNGGRTTCRAEGRGTIRLVRQMSDAPCREGSSWGATSDGVWVDRGCRAEFAVSSYGNRRAVQGSRNRTRGTSFIDAGATIPVRTNQQIDVNRNNGRVYTGVVDRDVLGSGGSVAIPRGAEAELVVRNISNNEMVLDLESVSFNGQRYAVSAEADRTARGQKQGLGENKRTGEYVGGGALLGTLLGAVAGGGHGAAIGAAAGAAVGAGTQVATRGSSINVPAESVLTFHLQQPLQMGITDTGYTRDGEHYHTYDNKY